jgi:hypothetical protein
MMRKRKKEADKLLLRYFTQCEILDSYKGIVEYSNIME